MLNPWADVHCLTMSHCPASRLSIKTAVLCMGQHVRKHMFLLSFLRVLWKSPPRAQGSSLRPTGSRKFRSFGQVLTAALLTPAAVFSV